jgi:hypothetical protein
MAHSQIDQLPSLNKGDIFTVANCYKRRSFWEWLTRKPKVLQRFVVTEDCVTRAC